MRTNFVGAGKAREQIMWEREKRENTLCGSGKGARTNYVGEGKV